jgi:riboflavin transporter FmnP
VKPAARGLGASLLLIAALAGVLLLIVRKGPYGALMGVLMAAVALCVVTGLAVIFGKKKNNGQDV